MIMTNLTKKLPIPVNISNIWNFGRCLGLFLALQIVTGLLLSSHYTANTDFAFDRIISLSRDTSWGAFLRAVHLNGASFYFLFIYIHIGRGLYYGSYSYTITWITGLFILFFSMLVAFLGYVLPWGQISYWGATVITNLISAIPIVGHNLVCWIWGGFSISNATLNRFFIIHFCGPLFLSAVVGVHIYFLHKTGRQNPRNIRSKYNILRFHPFFLYKDILYFFFLFIIFESLVFLNPYLLGDPENFSTANIIATPEHIVPEWYFLFAYAILRCIPRKGVGVLGMMVSVAVLVVPALLIIRKPSGSRRGKGFNLALQWIIVYLLLVILFLTWLGGQFVSAPFVMLSQLTFLMYILVWCFMLVCL